jgi:hypothetical protein
MRKDKAGFDLQDVRFMAAYREPTLWVEVRDRHYPAPAAERAIRPLRTFARLRLPTSLAHGQ